MKTINQAAHEFVREMNQFPLEMIAKLWNADPDGWCEVSRPAYGDRVYLYDGGETGEVSSCLGDGVYIVETDDGETVRATTSDFVVEHDDALPMWGWMWQFSDICDVHWIEEDTDEALETLAACGFRVYFSEDFGYFFGIDGCGYDFYEAHWIPLYKARGLHWHDTDE